MKRTAILALCGILLLCGCNKSDGSSLPAEIIIDASSVPEESAVFPVEVRGVTLSAPAERVVSLSPAVTEVICELGFKDKLCGVSVYCDYPENIGTPTVGSSENPDIEGMIALSPDVVFTLSALSERDVYALNAEGISVIALDFPSDLAEYSALYRDISYAFCGRELTGDEKGTETAVRNGSEARTALESRAEGIPRGSFVYVTGKLTLAGSDTFESAVLSLIGENLCKESGYPAATPPETSEESEETTPVPDYIIADSVLTESDLKGDAAIAAMIEGGARVVFVSSARFERPSKRTAEVFDEIKNADKDTSEE